MNRLWASALALSLWPALAAAQDQDWRPGATCPAPAVRLGRPVITTPAEPIIRAQSAEPTWSSPRLGAPVVSPASGTVLVSGAAPAPPPPGPPPGGAPAPVLPGPPPVGVPAPAPPVGVPPGPPPVPPPFGIPAGPPAASTGPLFGWSFLGSLCGQGRNMFESDHCFDGFISPVSNPFFFEDPRSLTEVRPIYIYEHTPKSNFIFNGGNINDFGLQARLAITERLSFVINKLGFINVDPRDPTGTFSDHTGFSEMAFGPKYTFWRNDDTGTLAAAGLTVQLATGPSKVFQDTGSASLTPYLSFGQSFLSSSYGTFHFLNVDGYSFATDNQRTDYFYSSYHLDYDIGNLHKIYPLLELTWFHYTSSGTARPFGFEGRDLINFGSTGVSGVDSLTIATGLRYKFNENLQTGLAVEFPLTSERDLVNFRLTFDLIFRY